MGNSGTGVTGRGGKDGNGFAIADAGKHLRHKTAAKIFERQCRTVEQFQCGDFVIDTDHRSRKGKRLFNNTANGAFAQLITD